MMNTFEAQGYMITVEGYDFGGNTADFDKVCAEIERAAKTVDRAALAALVWDHEIKNYANRYDTRFYHGSLMLSYETLKRLGWDKPDVPWVHVSANLIPAKP